MGKEGGGGGRTGGGRGGGAGVVAGYVNRVSYSECIDGLSYAGCNEVRDSVVYCMCYYSPLGSRAGGAAATGFHWRDSNTWFTCRNKNHNRNNNRLVRGGECISITGLL